MLGVGAIRLWPHSLGGQLMLVAALSLMGAQIINLGLLVNGQRQERVTSIASGAAVLVSDLSERIGAGEQIPPWMSPRLEGMARGRPSPPVHGMRRNGLRRIVVDTRPHIRSGMTAWPEMAARVQGLIDESAGVRTVRAARGPAQPPPAGSPAASRPNARQAEAVSIAAQITDGRWITIHARVANASPRIGRMLIGQTLILFGLMLGPLLFVAWRVTRPLSRLAKAAGETRLGQRDAPLPLSGPRDVRNLTAAFNDMRGRIVTMLQDKDRMLGAIGHDLRTPLASLRVRVEQIKDEPLRDQMVGTIEEMAAMLDDVLALARAGQPREVAEPTDLAALVSSLVDDYQAMGRPVALVGHGSVVMRTVRPAALRRALRNLINNAVSYGGSATVGLVERPDGSVALTVEDDGPGIADDQIAAMIEPFARAEVSRNRDTGGSGLGLALASAIAIGEGGVLSISNRDPHGLLAQIILPT